MNKTYIKPETMLFIVDNAKIIATSEPKAKDKASNPNEWNLSKGRGSFNDEDDESDDWADY